MLLPTEILLIASLGECLCLSWLTLKGPNWKGPNWLSDNLKYNSKINNSNNFDPDPEALNAVKSTFSAMVNCGLDIEMSETGSNSGLYVEIYLQD